ncbi:type VII toxin-antitoxin system MntA family adenylyltransferase antitoxin [Pseudomonas massiliensis]|uniref:type VII toxin-antitoxin system MntA family adenylyltransferase antitoxin n=1 Tax=Pseudomonas massiliensis TaxID=522492 RepID=UPI00058BEB17|nr:nucleotidyltransferase domain-containing protein [Pseudomonas massiliensis]
MWLDDVERYLQASLEGLMAIYLFGSHANGTAGPASDVDLAVLIQGKLEPLRLWALSGELADITGCPVDLLDLRQASTVMQYQIITQGKRLWAGGVEAGLYEAFILQEKTELDTARARLLEDIGKTGVIHDR